MDYSENTNDSAKTETPAAPAATETAATAAPKPKRKFFSRFNLEAPLVTNGQARPDIKSQASFGMYRDNPFIDVRTNDPADQDNNWGRVSFRADPVTWGVFHAYVEELCAGTEKDMRIIKGFNMYKGNQKFDEPQHINTLLVGREEDGRIWFKILEDNRPAPVFFFGPPKFHQLVNKDKSNVDSGAASRLYALSTVRMLSMVMAATMNRSSDEDDTPAKPEGGGGQGGGGFNRGGGNFQRNGGGGGGWNRNGGGGGYNRGGGGGFNRGGGGGGGWNRNGGGGGGGNWNRGGGGGGGYNRGSQGGGGGGAQPSVSDDEISF